MSTIKLANVDTLADYIDRLCVELMKLSWAENTKRKLQDEHGDAEIIKRIDRASRDSCELRSQLKIRINELFQEVIDSKEYKYIREIRTFSPPKTNFSETLDDVIYKKLKFEQDTKILSLSLQNALIGTNT